MGASSMIHVLFIRSAALSSNERYIIRSEQILVQLVAKEHSHLLDECPLKISLGAPLLDHLVLFIHKILFSGAFVINSGMFGEAPDSIFIGSFLIIGRKTAFELVSTLT